MQRVERPVFPPEACAVTARSSDPDGFVDTLNTLPTLAPRVYVSFQGVLVLMEAFGLDHPDVVRELREELERTTARLEDAERELEEADKVTAAVYTLKQNGFTAGKKPGRPPKQQQNAA